MGILYTGDSVEFQYTKTREDKFEFKSKETKSAKFRKLAQGWKVKKNS